MLFNGEADIGIATESLSNVAELASFPFYDWHHGVIVPEGHPLLAEKELTLKAMARFPLVTYQEGFTGRAMIDQAFAHEGLVPDIVMSALDADVIKAYVELGLGIGIVAPMAFDSRRDDGLRLINCDHLFGVNHTVIAVRRGHYLRGFAYAWIELCNSTLNASTVLAELSPPQDD